MHFDLCLQLFKFAFSRATSLRACLPRFILLSISRLQLLDLLLKFALVLFVLLRLLFHLLLTLTVLRPRIVILSLLALLAAKMLLRIAFLLGSLLR